MGGVPVRSVRVQKRVEIRQNGFFRGRGQHDRLHGSLLAHGAGFPPLVFDEPLVDAKGIVFVVLQSAGPDVLNKLGQHSLLALSGALHVNDKLFEHQSLVVRAHGSAHSLQTDEKVLAFKSELVQALTRNKSSLFGRIFLCNETGSGERMLALPLLLDRLFNFKRPLRGTAHELAQRTEHAVRLAHAHEAHIFRVFENTLKLLGHHRTKLNKVRHDNNTSKE